MFQDRTKWNKSPAITSNANWKVIIICWGPGCFSPYEHEDELKNIINKEMKQTSVI